VCLARDDQTPVNTTVSTPNATARALWYTAPGKGELRSAPLAAPAAGELGIRMLYSGISRGTERLVFEGRVPPSEYARMRLGTQEGDFPFPVKYGYSAVGQVESGPDGLKGRTVFALHPHQDRFLLSEAAAVPVPGNVPPRRAVLAANTETALNILWDGEAKAGQRIAVIGGGIVGLLVAALASQISGTTVTLVDKEPSRADLAGKLGAGFTTPEEAPHDMDLVVHTSSSEAGLALALEVAGFEGTIVEASWYGDRNISVPLGGAFHSQRLRLISSQVGSVAPSHRARFTHRQRMEEALRLLADDRFDALIGEEVPFSDLPQHLPRLLAPDAAGVGAIVKY
jgi:NADPH:quinone reductase-like Zn-dependent oxidoreductase